MSTQGHILYSKIPVISSGVAYSAGDALGASLTLESVVDHGTHFARLQNIVVADADKQDGEIDFFFYDASITTGTDNAAYDPSYADAKKCVGVVTVLATDYKDLANRSIARKQVELDMLIDSGRDVYVQAVVRTAETYTGVGNLQFRFLFERE